MWNTLAEWITRRWSCSGLPEKAERAKTGVRTYFTVRRLFYVSAMIVAALLIVAFVSIWRGLWWAGSSQSVIYQGDRATETTVTPSIFPSGEVPVMRYRDTVQVPELEKVRVLEPQEVDVTVTTDALPDRAILIRERDPLFPDLRSPSAGLDADVLCLKADGECLTGTQVNVTSPARPLVEWSPEWKAGGGLYPSADTLSRGVYIGANLLRLGPVKLGAALRETRGHAPGLAGLPVDVAPDAGLRLMENVELTGSYGWRQNELMLGVSVTR